MNEGLGRTVRLALLTLCFAPAAASAMPGQSTHAFTAWAKSNGALHGLTRKMNEMSADPYYSASFRTANGTAGTFVSNVNDSNAIFMESVAVDSASDSYDILGHLDTAAALLRAVYGAGIAGDFTGAALVGRWKLKDDVMPTALYRGKQFGYEAAHAFVQVWPLDQVANQAKTLASCVREECGD
ncbi:MAG: hypothetical protein JO277_07355 [Candidatus Eremiobacteraeota bacterium]|nr:hypothetical protein [Candidatus Eremiobacteraeota bacterium]